MKLVEFTSAHPPHGPVFINPEKVDLVIRRYIGLVEGSPEWLTTETTIGLGGDADAVVDVIGAVEVVAHLLADTVTTFGNHPERVNDDAEHETP